MFTRSRQNGVIRGVRPEPSSQALVLGSGVGRGQTTLRSGGHCCPSCFVPSLPVPLLCFVAHRSIYSLNNNKKSQSKIHSPRPPRRFHEDVRKRRRCAGEAARGRRALLSAPWLAAVCLLLREPPRMERAQPGGLTTRKPGGPFPGPGQKSSEAPPPQVAPRSARGLVPAVQLPLGATLSHTPPGPASLEGSSSGGLPATGRASR